MTRAFSHRIRADPSASLVNERTVAADSDVGFADAPAFPADSRASALDTGTNRLFLWRHRAEGSASLVNERTVAADSDLGFADAPAFQADSRESPLDSRTRRADGCAGLLDSGSY